MIYVLGQEGGTTESGGDAADEDIIDVVGRENPKQRYRVEVSHARLRPSSRVP